MCHGQIGCRAIFATHYHGLTREFAADVRVRMQRMAHCVDASGFVLMPVLTAGET